MKIEYQVETGPRAWRGVLVTLALLAGHALLPAPAHSQCRVTGASTGADLALARAGCDRAVERFTLLFGAPPPAGVLEVSDTLRSFAIEVYAPEWKMVWPSTRRLEDFFGASGDAAEAARQVEDHWKVVLPHELGHVLLIAEADRLRPPELPARRLPDWLHEGVGVWMEPPAHRADDLSTLRAYRPFVPAIDSILRFRIGSDGDAGAGGSTIVQTFYPCASEEACGGRPHWSRIFSVRTRYFPDGSVSADTIVHTEAPPPPTPLGSFFYTYSGTFVRFLYDLGGAGTMRALLEGLARSPDGELRLPGLRGLPATGGRLEAEWRDWFERWVFGA
jgi:hypothetical protein